MNETSIKKTQDNPRRLFMRRALQSCGMLLATAVTIAGCGKKDKQEDTIASATDAKDCGDLSNVSEKDLAVREKLGYVKESPLADNQCQNCNLYLPPKAGETCGGCMLFKGPVYAEAYCTYWAPKI